jgi:nickel/cobalt transporter (NicO) family protein
VDAHPLLLGLLLGAGHAFEPDHLAAVTTLATRSTNARAAAGTGAAWGLGHALAIVIFGGALVAMGVRVPPRLAMGLELLVAAMLVALGVQALRKTRAHAHAHGDAHRGHGRSTLVGFVHGASGTAGLMLLYVTTIASRATAFAFLFVFAFGALLSMSALSSLLAGSLSWLARRGDGTLAAARMVSGVAALAAAVLVVASVWGSSDG